MIGWDGASARFVFRQEENSSKTSRGLGGSAAPETLGTTREECAEGEQVPGEVAKAPHTTITIAEAPRGRRRHIHEEKLGNSSYIHIRRRAHA